MGASGPDIHIEDRTIAGIRQRIRGTGNPAAREACVFVHGNPGSGEDFVGMMRSVAPVVRTVAPDMPGYGRSERPEDFDYSVPGYARQLAHVLDDEGVDRAHLVLHDFGGPWGLHFASEQPDRVATLTLVNIGVIPDYRWHWAARIWRTPGLGELFQGAAVWPLFRLVIDGQNPQPFPEAFLRRMYAENDAGQRRATRRLYRNTPDPGALTLAAGRKLAPRRLPTLVLWGERDAYLPVRFAERQTEWFDATVHRIPVSGHWPMIDAASEVEKAFVEFLSPHLGVRPA